MLAPVAAGALAPRERKVRDFDEDLSRFQWDQKSLFERPKLLLFVKFLFSESYTETIY